MKNVGFRLAAGEMAFLTGHSGAGKSTLLKLITAIERPTRGQVWIGQENISKIAQRKVPFLRRRIGIIFQDHKLLNDRRLMEGNHCFNPPSNCNPGGLVLPIHDAGEAGKRDDDPRHSDSW